MQYSVARLCPSTHHITLRHVPPFLLFKKNGLSTPNFLSHSVCLSQKSLFKAYSIPLIRVVSRRHFSSTSPSFLRYHPMRPQSRRREFLAFLDRLPQNTVFYGIIGLNATVFAMWFLANEKYVGRPNSCIDVDLNL